METNIKSYRLKQEDKDYIFITSMVGRTIKLACKTSSGHTFSRKFTLNELKNFDKVFYKIKSLDEVIEFFDKALKIHKVPIISGIEKYAFEGCTSIKHLELPQSISFIEKCAFRYCFSLESISFGDQLEVVHELAFSKCVRLKRIIIPADAEKTYAALNAFNRYYTINYRTKEECDLFETDE